LRVSRFLIGVAGLLVQELLPQHAFV
jgi:hypothetical protein